MVNGPLTAEIGSGVWGTPANFNEFCVLASLLHWRRLTDVNQTLPDVWPSPGTLYIHFRGLLPPNGILPGAKFTLLPNLVFCYIGSITAQHSNTGSGCQPNFVAFSRDCYLYSAGRPSRWASAHILVLIILGRIVSLNVGNQKHIYFPATLLHLTYWQKNTQTRKHLFTLMLYYCFPKKHTKRCLCISWQFFNSQNQMFELFSFLWIHACRPFCTHLTVFCMQAPLHSEQLSLSTLLTHVSHVAGWL